MATRYPLIVNPSSNQIQEIPAADALDLTGNDLIVTGITSLGTVRTGNINSSGIVTASSVNTTSLSVSGVSTLEIVTSSNLFSTGIVTASGGFNLGISSSGTSITSGPVTSLNFIGAGNTFAINGTRVDISISGGGSGGSSSQWVSVTSGIYTGSNVGIATTNPIQPFQVGVAGTNVVVVDSMGVLGIGTTNPTSKLHVVGDINLDDGGSFTTTLQTITPTANRTLSLPDATGTVALVAGSSGQLLWNNSGANAGASTLTYDGSILTSSGRFINSYNATASSPAKAFTGTWFTGGTATTTKPHVLIEPTGTTSTAWSTSGTGIGVNAPSGFAGNLLDLQVNGTSVLSYNSNGLLNLGSRPANSYMLQGKSGSLTSFSIQAVSTGYKIGYHDAVSVGPLINFTSSNIQLDAFQGNTFLDISPIGFSYTNGYVGPVVYRVDAANTFAQRNGTNAQTFRVYNTYTSGTNYELGKLEWSSNVFRIGTEKGSGGGTARAVEVHTDSVSRLALDTTGSVRVVTGLTVATLPGTPAVGMIARVTDATAPAVGSAVAGGGSAAALVWYNGTAWNVIGV